MINWLGQKIEVGSVVGRGTRQSSTSVFQVGEVTEVDEDKLKARVRWMYNPGRLLNETPSGKTYSDGRPIFDREHWGFYPAEGWRTTEGNGAFCTVESLFVLDPVTLKQAEELLRLSKEFYSRKHKAGEMTKQEWLDRSHDLTPESKSATI